MISTTNLPYKFIRFFSIIYNLDYKSSLKKLLHVRTNSIFVLLFLISNFNTIAQTNSCKATLIVSENRNIRSAPFNGTYYTLEITNFGNVKDTYTLSFLNSNSTCINPEAENTSENVMLTASFMDVSLKSIVEVIVPSGERTAFLVHINVPQNTQFNKWNCIEITATSNTCATYKVNTTLHTLVSDPSMD